VAKVYPELVTRGADGKVESVQYHEMILMPFNGGQHQRKEIVELKVPRGRDDTARFIPGAFRQGRGGLMASALVRTGSRGATGLQSRWPPCRPRDGKAGRVSRP